MDESNSSTPIQENRPAQPTGLLKAFKKVKDIPPWLALLVALGAYPAAIGSCRNSGRSATAGEKSAKAAEGSRDSAKKSAEAAEKSANTSAEALELSKKSYSNQVDEAAANRSTRARMEGPELIVHVTPRILTNNNQSISSLTYEIVIQNVGRDAARDVTIDLVNTVEGGQRFGEPDTVKLRLPVVPRIEVGQSNTNSVPHRKLRRLAWNTDEIVVTDTGCALQFTITYFGRVDDFERKSLAHARFNPGNGKFDVRWNPMELVSQETK
jgi:hypothetical protein